MNNSTLKLSPDEILKSLPTGFTGVSVPKKTRIVHLQADPGKISPADSKKAAKKLASSLGLAIAKAYEDGSYYRLEDTKMTKAMRNEAKTCLKTVKSFFSKYRCACIFDDITCDTIRSMNDVIENA